MGFLRLFVRYEVQAAEVACMAADHDRRDRSSLPIRHWSRFYSARHRSVLYIGQRESTSVHCWILTFCVKI